MSRTVYLGTSAFAATILRRVAATPHRPALVVAPPDRRRGRGRKELPPPVAETAAELGIALLQTADTADAASLERIRAVGADIGIVCAFGQIIREPLLSELPLLNVHPSLLPRWRGAAPIERAIMAGDDRTGVCVMRLSAGLDEGPVVACAEVEIGPAEDYGSLSARLADLGGDLLIDAFAQNAAGRLELHEQEGDATYAEKIERGERLLDPSRPAVELARAVRALTPHIGAQLELAGGERLGVRAAGVAPDAVPRGTLEVRDGSLILGCGEGSLRLEVLRPPGGREMAAADYLRGNAVPALAGA